MPRRKAKPKIKYVQVKNLDQSAIDTVFDRLFNKVLAQYKAKKSKQ